MDVANYFLATLGTDSESDLTNLKIQKLCSYTQGVSLALLDRPIFKDELQAWTHGPVIPALYYRFEKFGRRPLPASGLSEEYARVPFDDEQKFILELVKNQYGGISAWELRDRSHEDFPGDFGSKNNIPQEAIKTRFLEMPMIRKLTSYDLQTSEEEHLMSNEEFWDAVQA